MAEEENIQIITSNRKARHLYHIIDVFEGGMVLQGSEVKSLRAGKANLADSYAKVKNGEVWLYNLHISEYNHASMNNHEPTRPRKLLLNKREIKKIATKINERGFTLVPLSLYFNKGLAKVELAVAKGKKIFDKRKDIAEKDMKRDMERKLKNYKIR
jgi:SsrA-binding protein